MDKTNSKILTMSFALAAALVGFTLHLLIRILAGAFGVVARMTDSDVIRHGVPVAVALVMFAVLQFNPRVLAWGEEVVAEIRKVVWPSSKDVTAMTIIVIIFVILASIIITSFDFLSGQLMNVLVK
ncbi:MAG: preprotein translocase subunit SecE [Bdellovibrionaceae bacterium]|nr:preprotein translocase subunit SecE [Pseudobdellovibrionaceae bacterium]MBX3032442.1 preprotein translocase subunit SecE [Pseudobdellovibrionaceae bacterium]